MHPFLIKEDIFSRDGLLCLEEKSGGRGRIRTDERTKRADLQSASFSHLDTLPAKKGLNYHFKLELQDDCKKGKNYATCFHFRIESE